MSEEKKEVPQYPLQLTQEQIQTFRDTGVLVVPQVLSPSEVDEARAGFSASLAEHGVDVNNLAETAVKLKSVCYVSGGICEFFYQSWKMKVKENPKLVGAIAQLYEATFASDDPLFAHPYGPFNPHHVYAYCDRVNFRLPTALANEVRNSSNLGRGLGHHVDCNPYFMYDKFLTQDENFHPKPKTKWRPIQGLVALTPNVGPNLGGFEALPGFHKEFEEFFRTHEDEISKPNSEFYVFGPKHRAVTDRVVTIEYKAGDAVFWDTRIVHRNAEFHHGDQPREAIYANFLPDTQLNREYVAKQLDHYRRGLVPPDFAAGAELPDLNQGKPNFFCELSPLGRKLMGMDPWIPEPSRSYCTIQ
eukprot:TRINITY_DN4303_c0_g2_i1.p1 TRINITY_DN4303_c0_g2~~TRINITY_DN4303_c0_g2_i1.p1  ORF type:complete len:359 (+),score=25.62 TRINITY_DN4303_c0_g2_i1:91-1167(+)